MSTYIYNNGFRFIPGYTVGKPFTRANTEYIELHLGEGKSVVTTSPSAYPIEKFLQLVKDAGFGICPQCNGSKRIDPIENPPYICPLCDGKGYTISE